ncbi:MAG TPA: hypothetical protein EYP53_04755 [Candidatus Latescibacteria bacterium]|nr:hypothetical protein [Candidatus Latescibacterota bacterium]
MLSFIIRKEILVNVLSFRFIITFLLFFILVVGSIQMMSANYKKQLIDYSEAQIGHKEQVDQMQNLGELQAIGLTSEKKPNPLSIFSTGLEKVMSRSITASGWERGGVGGSKYANTLFSLYPPPDLVYIVNIVISLLAILFVFDSISGEKEEGTLKLMLSNPVPRDVILAGKWIGGYISLIVPFLLAVVIGMVISRITSPLSLEGDGWMSLCWILIVALLYISVFFALGVLISTFTRKSGTSLMVALFSWVILVLTIPNIVPIIAREMIATPSTGKMAGELQAIQREEWDRAREESRKLQSDEERQKLWEETSERIQKRWQQVKDFRAKKLEGQATLAMTISRISPSAAFVYATANLAGTGVPGYNRLREYARRFSEEFQEKLRKTREERRKMAEGVSDQAAKDKIMNAPLKYEELPKFNYREATFTAKLKSAQFDILLLVVFNVLFFMGSYAKFLRYDVT